MSTLAQPPPPKPASKIGRYALLSLSRGGTYFLLCAVIVLPDILSGPFLLLPILFVIPVALCAWFYSARVAYYLAVLFPFARVFIDAAIKPESAPALTLVLANYFIQMAVLLLLAYLASRAAIKTRTLDQRVEIPVTICSWSHTVEYEGEWISFAQFLQRRFNIKTSHGMSREEAQKILRELDDHDRSV